MIQLGKISQQAGIKCRKISNVNTIKGLALAAKSMKGVQEPAAALFLNDSEPSDAVATKELLKADEMVVLLDGPNPEYHDMVIDEKDRGAGIDTFLA